ncbi:hypothetical protein [Enterobacter phage 01_vB_Eclo_IJM]|nr:hypothetical protein [Enterobacter phage 01_vB_Eclo_IJM]
MVTSRLTTSAKIPMVLPKIPQAITTSNRGRMDTKRALVGAYRSGLEAKNQQWLEQNGVKRSTKAIISTMRFRLPTTSTHQTSSFRTVSSSRPKVSSTVRTARSICWCASNT